MPAVISDEASGPHVAEFFSPGPGERLRAARLSMGFDLAKVASELHLTTAIVERIERDDYENIGARVFVRGYLRNYARIVDMPSESVLRQFDEKWPDDPATQSMLRESPRLPADGGPSRGWAGAITWILILAAIALFLLWWRGYLDQIVPDQDLAPALDSVEESTPSDALGTPEADASPPSEGLPEPAGGLRLPTLFADSPGPAGVEEGASTTTAEGQDQPTDTPLPTLLSPATGVETASVAEPASAVDEGTSSAPALLDAPDRQTTSADSEAGVDAAGGVPTDAISKGIVLSFTAPCWVDVRDSSRKFKLFGEMPKGEQKVLGGEPPYKMVIGNARAVEISVNGEPFDIMPFAKGNVARFTLNP